MYIMKEHEDRNKVKKNEKKERRKERKQSKWKEGM